MFATLIISLLIATSLEIFNKYKTIARENLGIPEPEPRRKTCLQKYFSSFNLIENSSKLLFARSKDGDKNLEILNGVRVLSIAWVILGHTFYYAMSGALANPLIPLELFRSFGFNLVSSGPYAVDIFFWLSGFLGVYILLGATTKRNGKMQSPLLIYLHRYLRIIPLYVFTMLFFWFIMSAVGNGPIFSQFYNTRAVHCNSTWWIHLLFLNNFGEINDNANLCVGWTWYLPNDMQFFLLIPILVWILFRSRKLGFLFIALTQLICFIATFTVAWIQGMSPSYFRATSAYYREYYHRPWARIPPFFIGVVVAVLLHAFKNDSPEQSVCKRIMDKINESRLIRFIMYFSGTIIFWSMIFIFYWLNKYPDNFSTFFNVSFLTFSKGFFVFGMNLVLLPVLMGHFSLLRGFLAFDAFTPLARLTFGAYMVHPTFQMFDAMNTVRGEYLTINFGITRYLAWLVASFACSLAFTLLIETPFMNLEKQFLMGGGKKPQSRRKSSSAMELLDNPAEETIGRGKEIGAEVNIDNKHSLNGNEYHMSNTLDNRKEDNPKLFSINSYEENSEGSMANVDITHDTTPS